MSQTYGERPSRILGITDEWTAWQLDETCLIVGREMENESAEGRMQNVEGRRQKTDGRKQSYAPMKTPGMPKMKIPENGIW